jgi:glycosyltransferase involved in cell wall biosynthesis
MLDAKIVFIPSVSGGLGHVTRTLRLAQELEHRRPALRLEYVLDQDRLRESNLPFVKSTGYPVRVLPSRTRYTRDIVVRALLGDADLIVEDTTPYLIPYRQLLKAAWVSVEMFPLEDELFMNWPMLRQSDCVLWTYPAALGLPKELEMLGDKVRVTGPILGSRELPSREQGRRLLGFRDDERIITYSPRAMPFGRDFGERLLSGLVNGFIALRQQRPELRLILTGVCDRSELRFPDMPPLEQLDQAEGIDVRGVLSPKEIRALLAGADIVVAEGTTTTFEAIAAATPVLMVPGPIYETWLIGTRLYEADAIEIEWIEQVTPTTMRSHLDKILNDSSRTQERLRRAREFLGPEGTHQAADEILRILDARR